MSVDAVSTARTRLVATVVALEDVGDEVRSPLDAFDRLLDLPGPVRQEVAAALGAIPGWPVSVIVETESEHSSELPGARVAPPEGRQERIVCIASDRELGLSLAAPLKADLTPLSVRNVEEVVAAFRLEAQRQGAEMTVSTQALAARSR